MLSFISGVINAFTQASVTGEKARVARRQGTAAKANADRQAALTRQTAAQNWEIQSYRRKAMRQNQAAAADSARASRSASGFTYSGSIRQSEADTISAFEETIHNANISSAIAYTNEWQQAQATQTQGKLAKAAYDAEAAQYNHIAKGMRQGAVIATIAGGAAGVYGAYKGAAAAEEYNSLNAEAIARGDLKALDVGEQAFLGSSLFSGSIFNNAIGMNMFTASLGYKQSWDPAFAILTGKTPGFQHSKNSL